MTEENAVAKTEEGVVEAVEEKEVRRVSGAQGRPSGFDEVDMDEIIMPRLSILQGLSGMVVERKGLMGDLANSLTKENYGLSVEFIPLFLFKTRVRFEKGRGLVMMSRDNTIVTMAKDEFAEYQGRLVAEVPESEWIGTEPPKFHLVYNFPVLLVAGINAFPLCLSLMRTGAKVAKQFFSMACTTGEDFCSRVYTLSSKQISSDDGNTYALPVIEIARRASNEEYEIAMKQHNIFHKQKENIAVDLEEEPLADPSATTE